MNQKQKGRFIPVQKPRRGIKAVKRELDGGHGGAGLEIVERQENGKNGNPEGPKDSSFNPNGTSSMIENSGSGNSDASKVMDGEQKALHIPSTDISNDVVVCSNSDAAVRRKIKKDYVEPWDYCGNPPITLPFSRPSSQDPENQNLEPDESCKYHATKLGLHKESEDPTFFVVQIPKDVLVLELGARRPDTDRSSVPMDKADISTRGREIVLSPPTSQRGSLSTPVSKERAAGPVRAPTRSNPFEGFPGGSIGKMLVYKSGKVKWKIGDSFLDVAPGVDPKNMAQDLVYINRKEKTYCEIGQPEKKMVISLDADDELRKDSDARNGRAHQ